MRTLRVLAEALALLRAEPKLFVPRIATTFIYTAFLLFLSRVLYEVALMLQRGEVQGVRHLALPVVASLPALLAVDMLTYGMYASLAEQYRRGEVSLILALRQALSRWKSLLAIGVAALLFVGCIFVVSSLSLAGFVYTRSVLFALLTLLISLLGVVAFALLFFFAVPVAVLEGKGFLAAMERSASLGTRRSGEVVAINLIFMLLIFITMLIGMATQFRGKAFAAGVALFLAGRLVQAVVYTYMSVVAPTAYLLEEENG